MDQATTRTLTAKIQEYTDGVPKHQREDFVQDMWVLFLTIDLPRSNLAGFLNLSLFRARDNWLHRMRYQASGKAQFCVASEGMEVPPTTPHVRVEAKEAANQYLRGLLEAGLPEAEVQTVAAGLAEGLTQAEIAEKLGRSPQNFAFYIKKYRLAA